MYHRVLGELPRVSSPTRRCDAALDRRCRPNLGSRRRRRNRFSRRGRSSLREAHRDVLTPCVAAIPARATSLSLRPSVQLLRPSLSGSTARHCLYLPLKCFSKEEMVGAERFELSTSCTPSKRASQATLRPDPRHPSEDERARISGRSVRISTSFELENDRRGESVTAP
jgi:hypothetical protein